ncbi:DUF6268 family outer membrane beta-barrel protein [Aquimarina sp. MMG016]|uniref:DUF6268 family outer membrane beta-barrel protein n=1 Tax=Aquimarina sp. MMG016 TaxID=2822690 RepID=UPI001B3A1F1D|nr:DUF6268 family outer membrane beta-barrel protein [Aquimarina sp. MMG016]MBQ4819424.1 hypothetical protein [Aquimarina sp. MMG016]
MKYSYLLICFLTIQSICAQDYVDLVKVDYGNLFNAGFENNDATTNVTSLNVNITYPIKLDDNFAILTGIDFTQQGLDLFPNGDQFTLHSIRLKVGLNIKHSDRWSGTYLFLPKIASEKLHTDDNYLFYGGLAILKYQKSEKLQYRIGAYLSSEGFGILTTPILGLYYLSEQKKWEMTANLPINADVNYRFNPSTAIGFGFQAPVTSYSLEKEEGNPQLYTQSSVIEFGPYFQQSFLQQSILLRLQAGYSSVSYEVFEEGDTLPIRLSAFEFDDDRNRLNPEMIGNLFVKVGAVYRFNL